MENRKPYRLTRRKFLSIAAMGSAAAALEACTGKLASLPPTPTVIKAAVTGPRVGGSTVWAAEGIPHGLNPHTNPDPMSVAMFEHSYEGLTLFDNKMNLVPGLAESWEQKDDTTVVFHLRKNAKWHDGSEFTADDVKYTFDWILDESHPVYWRGNFDQVDHVEIVDKNTIKFITKKPFPPLLAALASLRNSAIIKQGSVDKPEMNTQMNGTGPYRQVEYVAENYLKLARNKDWWGSSGPYIDDVTFKILQDEDTRVAGLRGGTLDYAMLTAQGQERLKDAPGLSVVQTPVVFPLVVEINMNRKPFDDVRVRQAMSLAIDRQEVIDKGLSGAGALTGPIPTGLGNYFVPNDELKSKWYKPDIEKAKQLLQEAGYTPDREIDYMIAPWNDYYIPCAIVVADQLKRIGMNIKVRQIETGVFDKDENPPVINFDICSAGFSPRHDPDGYLWQRFHSDSGKNEFANGYRNDKVDTLLLQARTTLDANKRKDLYDEAQRILLDEEPNIWLGVISSIEAVRSRIKGYTPTVNQRRAWGLKNAWIEEA